MTNKNQPTPGDADFAAVIAKGKSSVRELRIPPLVNVANDRLLDTRCKAVLTIFKENGFTEPNVNYVIAQATVPVKEFRHLAEKGQVLYLSSGGHQGRGPVLTDYEEIDAYGVSIGHFDVPEDQYVADDFKGAPDAWIKFDMACKLI